MDLRAASAIPSRSKQPPVAASNTTAPPDPCPINQNPTNQPTISISHSNSQKEGLDAQNDPRQRPQQARTPSTSSSSDISQSQLSHKLGQFSLKKAKKTSDQTYQDDLTEWASNDIASDDHPEQVETRSVASSSSKTSNRFGLRRKTSKMLGRDKDDKSSAVRPSRKTSRSPSNQSTSTASVSPASGIRVGTDLSASKVANESSAAPDDRTSIAAQPTSNVTGRIGGWFNSILHSSQNGPNTFSSPPRRGTPSSNPASPSKHQPLSGNASTANDSGSPSKRSIGNLNLRGTGDMTGSPTKKNSDGPQNTGRLGPFDRMLDKAVQYFLDSDSSVSFNEADIWLMGVKHPGHRPQETADGGEKQNSERPSPSRISTDSSAVNSVLNEHTVNGWPSSFYHDFYSRVALTYRSNFPPIPATTPASGLLTSLSTSFGRGGPRTSEGLSTDTGWGCMLRTGQSMLANALVSVHLGRDWRRSLPSSVLVEEPVPSPEIYARLLSLFLDDPSPLAPFSVHRFALMGKQLGKEVGEWFGPSTAAGAIKSLVNNFEPAGLKVVNVVDGAIYCSDVEAVAKAGTDQWQNPVLILVGLRLGIDGVNPIYHESIKGIFRFPQSLGIVGGRPSSSYYFVGSQEDTLFYIDPHFSRPSVPLRQPPPDLVGPAQSLAISEANSTHNNDMESRTVRSSESFVQVGDSSSALKADQKAASGRLGAFLLGAYPDSSWRTYHCDKVRKMHLSSMDPSMLLGFLIRNEADWADFRARVREMESSKQPIIFTLSPTPPAWMRRSSMSGPVRPSAARRDPSLSQSNVTGLDSPGPTPQDANDSGDEVEEFSEPEEWELESTDASQASSLSIAAIDVPEEHAVGTPPEILGRVVPHDAQQVLESDSIRRVGTPPLSGDEGVVVDTPVHRTPSENPASTLEEDRWQGVNGQELSADDNHVSE